jgi:hypothetical protein
LIFDLLFLALVCAAAIRTSTPPISNPTDSADRDEARAQLAEAVRLQQLVKEITRG